MSDVGRDEDGARRNAERGEEHERLFAALPPAGSPAYWARLADTSDPLPLEVLARCCRERYHAGREDEADRVLEVLMRTVQPQVRFWSRGVASRSRAAKHQGIVDDLEQECYWKLWTDLTAEEAPYLLTSFVTALGRLEQHVAHKVMIQAGEWHRPGTKATARVPASQVESIDMPRTDDEGHHLESVLADPLGERDRERLEAALTVEALMHDRRAEDNELVRLIFEQGATQKEAAAALGVDERTVRNRLQRLYADLRAQLQDGEEDSGGTR